MKLANLEGVTNKSKRVEREGITEEEEKILWNKGLLGCHTAQALLYTIYLFLDTELSTSPGRDTHKSLISAITAYSANKDQQRPSFRNYFFPSLKYLTRGKCL